MAVIVGSARIDENGNANSGKAGDQNTKEVSTQNWYLHTSGWRVFRLNDHAKADLCAKCMKMACDNQHIGYDQWQRDTLYNEAKQYNFDVSKVTKDVECDCSSLVRVCLAYAGIKVDSFRTYNEPKVLTNTGKITELVGDKYTKSSSYLRAGDILCTPVSGHTVIVLSNGANYVEDQTIEPEPVAPAPEKEPEVIPVVTPETITASAMLLLKSGSKGAQVRTLQRLLNGVIGAGLKVDGEYGPATKNAVKRYQTLRGLDVDGQCGEFTWYWLMMME